MKILLVASECAPFVKTGGLADVVGALPKALAGVEARILLPLYPALREVARGGSVAGELGTLHGGPARLVVTRAEGLDLMLLDAPHLYDRPGSLYLDPTGRDWADNHLRFGALCAVAARCATEGLDGWHPDLVHCHDWQAGLVPLYLSRHGEAAPPSVMTIHNIAFQGLFDPAVCAPLDLPPEGFNRDGYEYYGKVGFLKAGLVHADRITTVSPTYAAELMQPEFGMGLEGLLRVRRADLTGILNGIDTTIWDPETDPAIHCTYSRRILKRKAANRTALSERFDLHPAEGAPLFGVISRLTAQKGLDLLLDALPVLIGRGARLALLGSGEPELEAAWTRAAAAHPGRVGVVIGYDEALAHQMQAGADAILVPSRFEPCGLTQLCGLRYGTLPVVARTGGLADTVIDANQAALDAGCATGVQFAPITAEALGHAIERTCDVFSRPRIWATMQRNAMRHPVGWDRSAEQYINLFEELTGIS